MIKIGGQEYELIDAHFHVWETIHGYRFGDVPMRPAGSGRVTVGEKVIQFMAPSFADSTSPIEVLEAEMENNGVDRGVLLQTPCYGQQYEYVDSIIRRNPGKFVSTGLAWPCHGKDVFLKEANEALRHLEVKAIKFEMPDTPFDADAKDNAYIFEFIQDHGLYCMIDMGWGTGPYDYPFEAIKTVVERYKDLTFIFPHLGVSRLWDPAEAPGFETLRQTLSLMECNENVWFDIGGLPMLTGFFEEYPYPVANAAFQVVWEEVGMDHMMFGTDYPGSTPFCTYQQSIQQIARHCDFLSDSDKIKLFSSNAKQLWFGEKA